MVSSEMSYGENLVKQAKELVVVVISEGLCVKAFVIRWRMLNSRLQELRDILCELQESPFFSNNTLCTELLESMVDSLQDSRQQASMCTQLNYTGKLQMQSTLDILGSKFDRLIHDMKLMIDTGVLRQTGPTMTLSITGTTKESRKWTVKDLLARLQIGSTDSRIKALNNLLDFMNEDDKNLLVVVAANSAIASLIDLLDSSAPVMRERASYAVARLATVESCIPDIVKYGALQPLVRLIDSGSAVASEKSAEALQRLTNSSPENCRTISSLGAVSALLHLCESGTPNSQVAAAGVLRNLSSISEIRQNLVEEDSITVLIYLISSGASKAREYAAVALQNLANSEKIREMVVYEGGVDALVRLLDAGDSSSEAAIRAICTLAAARSTVEILSSSPGLLQQLCILLSSASPSVQNYAASTIVHVAASSFENRTALGDAGCIGPLVKMLDSAKTREYSVRALANLVVGVEKNKKCLGGEENGILGLVRTLETSSAEYGVSALWGISAYSKYRKEIVNAAGACYNLERLVEKEVVGAKKLLERLHGGKLRNLLLKRT